MDQPRNKNFDTLSGWTAVMGIKKGTVIPVPFLSTMNQRQVLNRATSVLSVSAIRRRLSAVEALLPAAALFSSAIWAMRSTFWAISVLAVACSRKATVISETESTTWRAWFCT